MNTEHRPFATFGECRECGCNDIWIEVDGSASCNVCKSANVDVLD